jgi:heparanase
MLRNTIVAALGAAILVPLIGSLSHADSAQATVQPQKLPKIADVDPRFLSFNVEAVEITGGRFWKPYKKSDSGSLVSNSGNQPSGMDANLFLYRPPINLANPKIQVLAKALSPAYLRVSGTWRNSTYFQDDDKQQSGAPPEGFKGVMTRSEWKGVIDFANATQAQIVTSVAISAGVRDAAGVWTPQQAKAFFDYTRLVGGHIAATEFMNEPTFAMVGGAPKGYDAGRRLS